MLGLHRFLPKTEIKIGSEGLFAGLGEVASLDQFGFLLGNAESEKRKLIGIYEDKGVLRVVKAGCGAAASDVRGECESMRDFASLVVGVGVPECQGLFEIQNGTAYVAELVNGRSPRGAKDDVLVFDLQQDWLGGGSSTVISDLSCWKRLDAKLDDGERECFVEFSSQEVVSPVMHGDFAPWNIKISDGGSVKVLDWEFAEKAGMPSWDWLHYHVQRMRLVEGASVDQIVKRCRVMLAGDAMRKYLYKAGVAGDADVLLGSYLCYSGRVLGYSREDLISHWVSSVSDCQ